MKNKDVVSDEDAKYVKVPKKQEKMFQLQEMEIGSPYGTRPYGTPYD